MGTEAPFCSNLVVLGLGAFGQSNNLSSLRRNFQVPPPVFLLVRAPFFI